jgi:GNAT superfamily N-acetyltransferase
MTMPGLEFREIALSEVPVVARLPQPGEAGGDPPDRMARYLRGEHHPQHALAPRQMWVAWDGPEPVGYVAGHLSTRFGCDGELQWIYVVARHRRRRVASELLGLLIAWFGAGDARRICVNVGDERARPFYAAAGAIALQPHWMVWEDIARVTGTLLISSSRRPR